MHAKFTHETLQLLGTMPVQANTPIVVLQPNQCKHDPTGPNTHQLGESGKIQSNPDEHRPLIARR